MSDQRYRTIVADPPWDHSDGTGLNLHGDATVTTTLPYQTMTVEEIKALPVARWAEGDKWHVNGDRGGCNLFLWTTARYLVAAHEVCEAWRFKPTAVLVWCKPPRGFGMGGTFKNNVEFVVVGRRGSPPAALGSSDTRWFQWPRGPHSAKPEAFIDLVESVSDGPYLELFARRARFGWDYWGDESLGTAEMPEALTG
jgi:N6-adenosine-specific RNA methylase IME4